jgi:hypothetical protein
MTELEALIARAVYDSGVDLTPIERKAIVSHVAGKLREEAQIVRMEMEHVVWGTVQ